MDPDFPMHLWDKLVDQAEATIKMLSQSRIHPHLSTYDSINGAFNFNKTPLSPPGNRVLIHNKTGKRKSWDPAGTDGWYVGEAWDHYSCYECYVPKTRAFRNCDTVDFFPLHTPIIPKKLHEDIIQKLNDLISIYKGQSSKSNDRIDNMMKRLRSSSQLHHHVLQISSNKQCIEKYHKNLFQASISTKQDLQRHMMKQHFQGWGKPTSSTKAPHSTFMKYFLKNRDTKTPSGINLQGWRRITPRNHVMKYQLSYKLNVWPTQFSTTLLVIC